MVHPMIEQPSIFKEWIILSSLLAPVLIQTVTRMTFVWHRSIAIHFDCHWDLRWDTIFSFLLVRRSTMLLGIKLKQFEIQEFEQRKRILANSQKDTPKKYERFYFATPPGVTIGEGVMEYEYEYLGPYIGKVKASLEELLQNCRKYYIYIGVTVGEVWTHGHQFLARPGGCLQFKS